jgi:Zn-finger nucleic acid-binding protein
VKCPNDCATPLVMSERQGVEIDYCPTCRGVWLDRGELDKIIERSHQFEGRAASPDVAPAPPAPPPPPAPAPYPQPPPQPVATYPVGGYGSPYKYGGYKRKKRKGFLDEIFDF